MKKEWKHINFEQRKVISSGIAHNLKAKEIANQLDLDPTSISKEIKRNRDATSIENQISICKKNQRWPYVCYNCNQKYTHCPFTRFKYDAKSAQRKADINLINSRKGLDIDSDEFKTLDTLIKSGISEKKSIYQIKIENNNIINQSLTTLYRYINNGYLTTKK